MAQPRNPQLRARRTAGALLASVCVLNVGWADPMPTDALLGGFQNPPNSARPRVWWHWMNGNITADGVKKDLEWMARVGIGGMQNFDAALNTPQIVDKRLVYMSPEWKAVFREAAARADELGLELAIASSPGWSESGGPWVKPEDAMKKLVWSETTIAGGRHFHGQLPHPPTATGPYQTVPLSRSGGLTAKPVDVEFYHDAAVLAYREDRETALPKPTAVTANGQPVAADALLGDSLTGVIPVPAISSKEPGTIELRYAKPQSVQSAVIFISDIPQYSMTGALKGHLEAADDHGDWRSVADVPFTAVPTTVSFAPVTATRFRLVFTHDKPAFNMGNFSIAPGVDLGAMAAMGDPNQAPTSKVAQFKLLAQPRINAFEQKAGFAIANSYYPEASVSAGDDAAGVAPDSVIDITDKIAADGTLDWKAPGGSWRVVRLGYSLTGKTNHPATAEATGLEVDKYDRAAVGRYINTYLDMYRDASGDRLGSRGVRALVTDSTEVGASNWTADMVEDFKRLRGYDPRPWLPALTGTIVGSRDQSDRFLYDFRRSLGELMANEH
jgi:alpha-L-rhamnosidase